MDVKLVLNQMTLEEKAALCSGKTFWKTKDFENLDIPSIFVCDGPHGLRKQEVGEDNLGVKKSVPSTCFPTSCALSSSWDENLAYSVGDAIAKEALAVNVDIVLGPGINIKRSPLCGRNFEYFSEDPYLTGKLASSLVNGIQSNGIGTSLKHFALNNQENERMTISSTVDLRTMREIYLSAFEMVVKETQPYTVMCSYNLINGEYASDNRFLLDDVLRKEWGFDGFVVTDWGALNDKVASIMAGCDLEMPTSNGLNDKKIVDAVNNGQLDIKYLDLSVERILRIIDKCVKARKANAKYDIQAHNELARDAAAQSIVLLKNDNRALPLNKNEKIAVIGEFAKKTRFQGGGSSHVNAHIVSNAYDEIVKLGKSEIIFSRGYSIESDSNDDNLIKEAVETAKSVDKVVLFIGLPDSYESEGYDRENIDLPKNQIHLLNEIAKSNKNIIVALYNGSVIEIASWRDKVSSIVECWLGGQAVGGAVADILFGVVNPSGRLCETFPIKLQDNPSYLSFRPFNNVVNYTEGIYVGYRYYESVDKEVAYPFGFGLSYSSFEYANMEVDNKSIKDTDEVNVTVKITNKSDRYGKEVVQLYVGKDEGVVQTPKVQLRGFEKVGLNAGESKIISFKLSKRDFAYYDVLRNTFAVESNDYFIKIGSNCHDIKLETRINVTSTDVPYYGVAHPNTKLGDLLAKPKMEAALAPVMGMLMSFFEAGADAEVLSKKMIENTIKCLTVRALVNFTGGKFSEENMNQVIDFYNSPD